MKLRVIQENLSKSLSIANRFVSNRAQLPVLANILLSAKSNKLILLATNLELSISLAIGAKVASQGEITVPSKVISDIISNLSPGLVNLSSDKEILKITSNGFSSTVSGMNSSDFPKIPTALGKNIIQLLRNDFLKALSKILFAVSDDETRPYLTGVLFIFKKERLILVSTDGFRLSQTNLPVSLTKDSGRAILPKAILNELVRIPTEEANISFSFQNKENQVVFSLGNTILSSRILEGDFPNFEKIIPKDTRVNLTLGKDEFLQAVRLASVFARDSANMVKILIKKDDLEILAESQYTGSQKTKIDAKIEGEEMEIAFNYRFLEDFCQAVEGDNIQIELSGPNSPGIFRDLEDGNYLHLIMPVKIQE